MKPVQCEHTQFRASIGMCNVNIHNRNVQCEHTMRAVTEARQCKIVLYRKDSIARNGGVRIMKPLTVRAVKAKGCIVSTGRACKLVALYNGGKEVD